MDSETDSAGADDLGHQSTMMRLKALKGITKSVVEGASRLSMEPTGVRQPRLFTLGEVEAITAVSPYKIKKLEEAGILEPTREQRGSVSARFFTSADIYAIRKEHDLLPQRPAGVPPCIMAISSLKGGAAKTTTAVYSAIGLALRGYRTALIDLDAQGSASSFFQLQAHKVEVHETAYPLITRDDSVLPAGDGRGVYDAINYLQGTTWSNLAVIPSALSMYPVEYQLPLDAQRYWIQQRRAATSGSEAPTAENPYYYFRRSLESMYDDYDVIILDCPPSMGAVTIAALAAANTLIIPQHAKMLDLDSTASFLEMLTELLEEYAEAFKIYSRIDHAALLVTDYQQEQGKSQSNLLNMINQMFNDFCLPTPFLHSQAVIDASKQFLTTFDVRPGDNPNQRRTYLRATSNIDQVVSDIEGAVQTYYKKRALSIGGQVK